MQALAQIEAGVEEWDPAKDPNAQVTNCLLARVACFLAQSAFS
jgi:hypothetical protein